MGDIYWKKGVILLFIVILSALYFNIKVIQKRSVMSFIVEQYLWATKDRRNLSFDEKLNEIIKNQEGPKMDNPSFILGKEVKEYMVYYMQVFDFNKIEGMNQKAIIHIHGGSYIHHGVSFHFKMLKNISSKTN